MAISLKKQVEAAQKAEKAAGDAIYALGSAGFQDLWKVASEAQQDAYRQAKRVLVALQFEAVSKGRAYWMNPGSFTGFTWTK